MFDDLVHSTMRVSLVALATCHFFRSFVFRVREEKTSFTDYKIFWLQFLAAGKMIFKIKLRIDFAIVVAAVGPKHGAGRY